MEKPNQRDSWTPTKVGEMHTPAMSELCTVLQNGLASHFGSVSAEVVDSPDFRKAPFHLAAEGLGGSPRLADVGGPPYLVPTVQRHKVYSMEDVAKEIELPTAAFIGAGAGSSRLTGLNCELMPNTNLATSEICTHFAKMKDGKPVLERYMSNEFGLLGNLYASEGKPGKVIKVHVSARTGDTNFITAIRKVLGEHYGEKPVALGGVTIMNKGSAKLHVMPDFSSTPLTTDEEVNEWLHGLDLRVEHTHVFSEHGQGGHYHYDVTPTDVEYTGYFGLAEKVFRIDAPSVTHQVGRD